MNDLSERALFSDPENNRQFGLLTKSLYTTSRGFLLCQCIPAITHNLVAWFNSGELQEAIHTIDLHEQSFDLLQLQAYIQNHYARRVCQADDPPCL